MVEIVGERSYPGVDNKIGMTFFDIRKKNRHEDGQKLSINAVLKIL